MAREVAGRGGKGVTVITGLPLGAAELDELAGKLKRSCGAGGSGRDGDDRARGRQAPARTVGRGQRREEP